MLHEVLLALTGHCGGVFKDNGDGIKVLEDLPFIHPSEVNVLNQLCRLGTLYRGFKVFIHKYGSTLSFQNAENSFSGNLHGMYIKAFCHGLDEVLQDYRQLLLQLEQDIIADPHLPVSHLQCTLQPYQLLFPALSSVIEQIKSHKAHGCYILDIVHKNSICGLPSVKEALHRVLHVCHGVMFKQLCAWLLHGSLVDPYREFFIQQADGGRGEQTDEDTQETQDDELGIMGVTGRQLQRLLNLSSLAGETPSLSQFTVQADLLPAYIPTRVSSHILFVGESVQMFEHDRHKPQAQKIGSILKNREQEFARALHELSKQSDFNSMQFESLIDKIRTYVAEHLWVLIVQDSGLMNQIRIMKDFYLLGRGELYLAFIDQAQLLLKAPPTGTTEHDVNMAYQQSARNVLLEDENFFQHFHLTVTSKAAEKKGGLAEDGTSGGTVETGWKCLGLTCTIQWPLHIFFTPNILDKYNRIFRFLLAVKKTQTDLQSCWTFQMQRKKKTLRTEEAPKWQLRTHMMFLVDNLQYYLQVDVIESQYGILLEKINSTGDFEAVKLAHEQFLVTLLSQSFVHMKSVSSCLYDILELCSTFSRLVNEAESANITHTIPQLQTIAKNFQRQSSLLFKILSSVRSHNASPHLAQLLLRLDFNRYFSTAGGQLGSI
ncbi:gamma-tubulin complex component 4-like [Haliotis cracherodii]|uniref:gamma-tubulin complex component 4-like n=1 Tax=Haliotis cracherodii TaxID=6455 RepID=UPI0039ED2534